ncbi:MAG TPA: MlaD family protein [Steroidobacteraceae bacterium]|nr:MlaD family protein [Steroidobacteraceae bacterium]
MSSHPHSARAPRRTIAIARRSWWPGWIWAVPIAAIGIVLWLLLRSISSRGIDVTVTYNDAAGMQAGDTKVMYHGVEVGRVSSVALASDDWHVVVHLNIDRQLAPKINTGTRFVLEGVHPSLSDVASLRALIAGPTIVMVPGLGKPALRFSGTEGGPRVTLAVSLPYLVSFDGAVGQLKPHAPVTLRGFTVGEVTSIGLSVDPRTGGISTPVLLALDPTRFHLAGPAPPDGNWKPLMDATLAKLIGQGLRASLTRALPLVGGEQVGRAIVPDAQQARLEISGEYAQIPAAESGGLERLPAEISALPLTQIANNLRTITDQVRSLTSSPQLHDSLAHLDATLAALERISRQAGAQVAPTLREVRTTVASLRAAAQQMDATAQSARLAMGTSPAAPSGNLQHALDELAGAARAVRSLANYLDEHPEALVRGRMSKARQ